MKKSIITCITLLSSVSTAMAGTSDNELINRFYAVTNNAAISSVSPDDASSLYHKFCSSAGEFHYDKHSSVRNSIDFDGSRDFSIRCNLLNTQRATAASKGLVCVGNTKILNEREDFTEVTSRKRIEILPSSQASCNTIRSYLRDKSDDTDFEAFEVSPFTIAALF